MKPLPKQYEATEAEPRWQEAWENKRVYAWDSSQPRANTFVIDTPPPTVSGVLHMGHIFSYTQADFVARFQRMLGKTVFYPMGFDDNGLPTERLVEKIKGKKASQYPTREDFIKDCKEVVFNAEEEFRALFKSVALSVDWQQEYQTVSPSSRALSQASFLDLLQKGQAYRDFRPTYWDWVDQTAIAQAEIENKEMPGTMNTIEFTLEDGTPLHIATTRPELLGACVAVMYHPADENAAKYKSKHAVTPVFGVKVPMIEDDLVEQGKGTGLVMCCTFGDDTDKEWWRKHQLPMRALLNPVGKLTYGTTHREYGDSPENPALDIVFATSKNDPKARINLENSIDFQKTLLAFEQIRGLKPKQANTKMLELLQAEGKLIKQENITHTVKCAERSGTPIEIIPTYQWFVRITDKKDALKAKGAECGWHPEFMKLRLDQWIDGLKEDWCVSRQRFFGVPFPVWYSKRAGEEGKLLFADHDQLPVDPLVDTPKGYTREEVDGDRDVMDTWATSSVSPQISAHGISPTMCKDADRFNKLFPADLRPQAHEIIRTWAFYTIVKAHLHTNTIPWKHLMISGWCLASDKTKMSKSKGNVITPVDLIRDKGADAVRYWASTSRLGADTAFSEDLLKIGKKLVNKLWNATTFASIHLGKIKAAPKTAREDVAEGKITAALDLWILTRLQETVAKATQNFHAFEYCDARVAVEEFFWKDFCDNYLELVKVRAYNETPGDAGAASAHLTLYHCLNTLLRLFAPFLPHICEELWHHLFDEKNSVHSNGTWPDAANFPSDKKAEASGEAAMQVLEAVRKAKSERNVSIKFPIDEVLVTAGSAAGATWELLAPVAEDLKGAGTITALRWESAAKDTVETPDKRFALAITFGQASEEVAKKA